MLRCVASYTPSRTRQDFVSRCGHVEGSGDWWSTAAATRLILDAMCPLVNPDRTDGRNRTLVEYSKLVVVKAVTAVDRGPERSAAGSATIAVDFNP